MKMRSACDVTVFVYSGQRVIIAPFTGETVLRLALDGRPDYFTASLRDRFCMNKPSIYGTSASPLTLPFANVTCLWESSSCVQPGCIKRCGLQLALVVERWEPAQDTQRTSLQREESNLHSSKGSPGPACPAKVPTHGTSDSKTKASLSPMPALPKQSFAAAGD